MVWSGKARPASDSFRRKRGQRWEGRGQDPWWEGLGRPASGWGPCLVVPLERWAGATSCLVWVILHLWLGHKESYRILEGSLRSEKELKSLCHAGQLPGVAVQAALLSCFPDEKTETPILKQGAFEGSVNRSKTGDSPLDHHLVELFFTLIFILVIHGCVLESNRFVWLIVKNQLSPSHLPTATPHRPSLSTI